MFGRAEPVLAGIEVPRIPPVWAVAPSLPGYIDRENYRQEIRDLARLERDAPAIVAFNSRSGMGKTALMRRCAAELRELFDIALYVDFDALRHDGAVDMGDVLARLLEDLYVAAQWIPASMEGRLNRYLSLLGGHRVLVLLDGASEPAQVLTLVPNSPSALVIVAGEVRLADLEADGVLLRRLAGLNSKHGAELLAAAGLGDRVSEELEQVYRLVDLCGGSPKGLRIAGGRLRAESGLSVAELVAELEAEVVQTASASARPDKRAEMTAGLHTAYRALPAETAHFYRLLGVMPSREFPRTVAAAAVDASARMIQPMLNRLLAVDLLEDAGGGSYRMPDLVRIHAREAAAAEETVEVVDESRTRVVWTWVREAAAADREVQKERYRVFDDIPVVDDSEVVGSGAAAAMGWFVRWHDSLLAVMRHAAAQELHGAVWRLFEAMWPFYTTHSYLQAWEEAGTLAVAAAQQDSASAALARVLCLRSRVYVQQKDFATAERDIDLARQVASTVDDGGRLFASVLDFSGQCHYAQKRNDAALQDFEHSLAINERLADRRGIALQSQFCGRCLGRLGRIAEALVALDRAAALISEFADSRAASKIAFSRGQVLIAAARDSEAVASLHEAVALGSPLGASELITPPLELLVDLARRHGDLPAERGYLSRLVELHRAGRSPDVDRLQARLDGLLDGLLDEENS